MKSSAISLFGSQVGRRIFGLMALSALVPLIMTLIFSQVAARKELDQTLQFQLRDSAKTYGMGILSVLEQHVRETRLIAMRMAEQDSDSLLTEEASRYFTAVWEMSESGDHRTVLGNEALMLPWHELDLTHLARGQSQLLRYSESTESPWLLIVPVETGLQKLLAVRIPRNSIWKPSAYLPPHTLYCVFVNSRSLVDCTSDIDAQSVASLTNAASEQVDDSFEWRWNDEAMLSASWNLFLGAGYGTDDLRIISAINKERAYRSLNNLQSMLPPLIAAVVAMVTLLSIRLMRRNLVPLRDLTNATKEYADGNLKTRIDIDREDEFGQLGSAFNNMAARLDRQFDALRTMSGVDAQILAGESIDQICDHFLRELTRFFSVKFSAICLVDADSLVNAHLIINTDDQVYQQRITLTRELDLPDPAEQRRKGTGSLPAPDPAIVAELKPYGTGRTLAFPLITNGRDRGLVFLNLGKDAEFNDEQSDLCLKLINRLSIGIASIEREETLYKKSHYDDLTQLPNRQLLKDRLAQCLANISRTDTRGALLFVDLDRFKEVNDVYGHSVGDKLLLEAAMRMRDICDDELTVARLGGDEFVVLMPEADNHSHIRSVASAIIEKLSLPFDVAGRDQVLGASIGISIFPEDGKSVEISLRNADAAMYRAKAAGRGRYEFYSEEMNAATQRRLAMERELRNAIKQNELQLYLQPQIDMADGKLRGAECLLRWNHPTQGWISPGEFIPIAEEAGLIVEMGRWSTNEACKLWRQMLDDGIDPGVVSVNVSGRELEENEFAFQIIKALESQAIDPGYMEIEITESIVARDKDLAMKTLTVLRNLGVSIAMDDFGTGYSSLSFLSHLPLNCIKVDQSFVSGIGTSSDAESLCRTIVSMAHELGKVVVAEGIEEQQHADFLSDLGCEYGQGYLFARPMPAAEYRAFAEQQQAQHSDTREIA